MIPTALTLFMVNPSISADAAYKVPPRMERILGAEVRLSGPIEGQVEGVVKNWLVPLPETNPAILQMFRDRDKEPYRNLLAWSGEFAGKYLTSGTETLRLTGDPTLRATLQKFVDEFVRCQDTDGYLGPFPKANRLTGWAPNTWGGGGDTWDAWGHYHAIVGLLSWVDATGDAQALVAARRAGDLLVRFFRTRTVASTKSPEMNQAIVHGLALLYRKTGERSYLEAAERVVNEFSAPNAGNYLEGALAGEEFFQLPAAGPRWESLHSIMGLAELYWITGKEEYRKAFEHLYWSIAKTDRHNNGGFTSGEQAQGDPYHRGAIETCCTIAWTAMGIEMLRMSGDPHVADELELSTLNQIVGLHSPDGAWCTYNTPMEGVRVPSTEDIAFQIRPGSEDLNCCSVNAARGFGMIADWALMKRSGGLALNWYGPSTLDATIGGTKVVLRQETRYPNDGRIVLHVDPSAPAKFPLSLRIPHWSAKTRLTVNGKEVPVQPGTYAEIDRTWQKGDTVTLDLDFSPRFWLGQRESRGTASVYRGPILMALEMPGSAPEYGPGWEQGLAIRTTKRPGAQVEFRFEGDHIRWTARRFDDAGMMDVSIDGVPVETVDLYGPNRDAPFAWERKGLGPGSHTLRLTAKGEKNAASRDVWVNVVAFEPTPPRPAFEASAFARAETEGDRWLVRSTDDKTVALKAYGSAGTNRTPYATWFPITGLQPAPFTLQNPSRTNRP